MAFAARTAVKAGLAVKKLVQRTKQPPALQVIGLKEMGVQEVLARSEYNFRGLETVKLSTNTYGADIHTVN